MNRNAHLGQESNFLTDTTIVEAYLYFLARLLVLRQEHLDFRADFTWNTLLYREVGGVTWANPNLDVAYMEAWLAVDDHSGVLVEVPPISERYYTFQVLDGWGETILNINDRTFPQHPSGLFALCLQGSSPDVPKDALRIDLPGRRSRVLARVELGADQAEAIRLQQAFKLSPTGKPIIAPPVDIPLFSNDRLPGAEAFNQAEAILDSEPDSNTNVSRLSAQVRAVARALKADASLRPRLEEVIRKQAIPQLLEAFRSNGEVRGSWLRPKTIGRYGSDYVSRSAVDLAGIWANTNDECVYFKTDLDATSHPLDGSQVYTMTFSQENLPERMVHYFWSVICVDSNQFHVIPNAIERYLLNNQSRLTHEPDGSLVLVLASELPDGYPESHWLPTPAGQNYNLTWRCYGPKEPVLQGHWFPPALIPRL